MKWHVITALFLAIGSISWQRPQQAFDLTTFTEIPKGMPEDIGDCGSGSYYLSKQDEINSRFACVTNYDVALIYINNMPMKFKTTKGGHGSYMLGKYTLIIKDGPSKNIGDEAWTMKSVFILKYNNTIVWTKKLIGYGGC
ncbi:MAG TPA: hypothetical protein VGI82_11760 [Chitinophagaceae bacterium]|jgi:hypothetical protein